jgi:hypothetical protein
MMTSTDNHYHPYVIKSIEQNPIVDLSTGVSDLERNSFEIYLRVSDQDGAMTEKMIRTRPQGMTNSAPVAQVTCTNTQGPPPLTVTCNAGNSTDEDSDLLHYEWLWGDGMKGQGR